MVHMAKVFCSHVLNGTERNVIEWNETEQIGKGWNRMEHIGIEHNAMERNKLEKKLYHSGCSLHSLILWSPTTW